MTIQMMEVASDSRPQFIVVGHQLPLPRQPIGGSRYKEMDMAVDQGQQDRAVGEIGKRRPGRQLSLVIGGHLRKPAVLDRQQHLLLYRSATAVNQPAGENIIGGLHCRSSLTSVHPETSYFVLNRGARENNPSAQLGEGAAFAADIEIVAIAIGDNTNIAGLGAGAAERAGREGNL